MMIENILRLCRHRLCGESYYKQALIAAVEVLAENWFESAGPSALREKVGRDFDLLVAWIRKVQPEVETMLTLHEQLKPQSLTFHIVEKPVISPVTKGENE